MNKTSKKYHETASFQLCIGYRETGVGADLLQQDTCVYQCCLCQWQWNHDLLECVGSRELVQLRHTFKYEVSQITRFCPRLITMGHCPLFEELMTSKDCIGRVAEFMYDALFHLIHVIYTFRHCNLCWPHNAIISLCDI